MIKIIYTDCQMNDMQKKMFHFMRKLYNTINTSTYCNINRRNMTDTFGVNTCAFKCLEEEQYIEVCPSSPNLIRWIEEKPSEDDVVLITDAIIKKMDNWRMYIEDEIMENNLVKSMYDYIKSSIFKPKCCKLSNFTWNFGEFRSDIVIRMMIELNFIMISKDENHTTIASWNFSKYPELNFDIARRIIKYCITRIKSMKEKSIKDIIENQIYI